MENKLFHAIAYPIIWVYSTRKLSGRDTLKLEAQAATPEVVHSCRDCVVHLVVNDIYQASTAYSVNGLRALKLEETRMLLTSVAYVHLKHAEVSKYTQNLAPASQTILLSGPTELYQQIQSRYGSPNNGASFKRSTSDRILARFI
ncbi:unnamed protein product [Lathyrus sativus]|nr:unnamed protein product [Lathyrus sativus]